VGGWEKFQNKKKQKQKPVGGRGENKVPKKKNRDQGEKKLGRARGENKVAKKTEIRAEKGQTKKVNLGWHRDRKENPISAPYIHVGALVGAGSLWPSVLRFS
jgi:hypothetical protein